MMEKNPYSSFLKITLLYLAILGSISSIEIFGIQKKRIYNALLNSSAKEVVDFNKVLKKLINSNERI